MSNKRQVSVRTTKKIFELLQICSAAGQEPVTTIISRLLETELKNPPSVAGTVRIAERGETFEKRLSFYVETSAWKSFSLQCQLLRIKPATRVNQLLLGYLKEHRDLWEDSDAIDETS